MKLYERYVANDYYPDDEDLMKFLMDEVLQNYPLQDIYEAALRDGLNVSEISRACVLSNIDPLQYVSIVFSYMFANMYVDNLVLPKNIKELQQCAFGATPFDLEELYYLGTLDEWDSIKKHKYWMMESNISYVRCKDGSYFIPGGEDRTRPYRVQT